MPQGLGASLSFDLTPLRPREWELEDAYTWNRAIADRKAYDEGIDLARKEAAGAGKVGQMLAEKQGRAEA
jgi:hypothetical protein